uniref:Putative inactive shikimate kinase like 1ic isoform X1 n=1 Tax=Rhizophora mucronata TaxID=61149 RepID=A0A2P2KAX6_RHIMU
MLAKISHHHSSLLPSSESGPHFNSDFHFRVKGWRL